MKRTFLSLLTAASALVVSAQEATTMIVGYCSDESTGAIGLTEKGVNVAAVKFSDEFLTQYAGNEVKSVMLQLGASFGSAGSIFITDELGETLPEQYPTEFEIPDFDYVPCYKWIEVPLPTPFTISADQPFYTGIRILPYTKAPYYGAYQFAVDDNVSGAEHCYIYDDSKKKWNPVMAYTFEDYPAPNFLIRLVLEGNSLPTNDVNVSNLQSIDYMRTSESCSCSFDVSNLASNDINSFDADLILDNTLASTQHVTLDSPLKTGESTACKFEGINFSNEGTHTIAVRVSTINGVADAHPENNTAEKEISVIDRYFDHKVLVEAFTTMSCANCPGAHERQEKAFAGVEEVIQVDHHSGFGTDPLTVQVDRDFLWFYNNGGTTYAPGMMFDRAMVDDFFDPQRSPGEEHTPIIGPGDPENILYIYNHLIAQPAYVDVNLDATYDAASRQLSVTIYGEAIAKLQGDNTTINLWLTESGLSAADDKRLGQMTSSGQLDMKFVHNHALRTSLTGSWGSPISLGLAPYSQTFTTKLDEKWKPENMEIVAFIANYDAAHPDNCMVHNSAKLSISSLLEPDGIAPIVAPSAANSAASYDLAGRRVSTSAQGVTIMNGRKQIR